jgi:hypothetical protein
MSRSIPSNIITQLESAQFTPFHLIKFFVNGTAYRYTDCEVPITATIDSTSQTFYSRQFTISDISYSEDDVVDSMSLKIDNLDQVLSALFIENVIAEQSFECWLVVLNSSNVVINTQSIFNGYMNGFDINESEVNLEVTSIFAKFNQNSYGKHSALCRWKKFKGTECAYSGSATTCDRTYATCVGLGNTANFGGFRYLPDLEDKVIRWGPTEKEALYWRTHKDPKSRY